MGNGSKHNINNTTNNNNNNITRYRTNGGDIAYGSYPSAVRNTGATDSPHQGQRRYNIRQSQLSRTSNRVCTPQATWQRIKQPRQCGPQFGNAQRGVRVGRL